MYAVYLCLIFAAETVAVILSLSLTGALTQVVKITVGRPRPGTLAPVFQGPPSSQLNFLEDLLDRCQPPAGLSDPPYKLTNWTICTQTDEAIMIDGFRSFFSGHSSCEYH